MGYHGTKWCLRPSHSSRLTAEVLRILMQMAVTGSAETSSRKSKGNPLDHLTRT